MVEISEWLPNPVGSDVDGEWVEIVNRGEQSVDLRGWSLGAGGKGKRLSGTIRPGEYRVLHRSETKLSLRNKDGALFLYDANGHMVDAAAFLGTSPEGKSMSVGDGEYAHVTDPTPSLPNEESAAVVMDIFSYPSGTILRTSGGNIDMYSPLLGIAVFVSVLILYILRSHGYFQEFFSGRD